MHLSVLDLNKNLLVYLQDQSLFLLVYQVCHHLSYLNLLIQVHLLQKQAHLIFLLVYLFLLVSQFQDLFLHFQAQLVKLVLNHKYHILLKHQHLIILFLYLIQELFRVFSHFFNFYQLFLALFSNRHFSYLVLDQAQ